MSERFTVSACQAGRLRLKKKDGDEEHAADNKPALKDKAPRAEKESPKAVSEPAVKEEAKTAKPSVVTAEKNSEKKESRKEETKECFKSDLEKSAKAVSLMELDNHTCRWPLGDPKDDNFHFCGKKVKIGQTYCEEHSAVAYVKPGKSK